MVEGFIQGRGPVKTEIHVQAVLWYVLFIDVAQGAPVDIYHLRTWYLTPLSILVLFLMLEENAILSFCWRGC